MPVAITHVGPPPTVWFRILYRVGLRRFTFPILGGQRLSRAVAREHQQ